MEAFIDKLFPGSQANAIRALWYDFSSRCLLEKTIGKKIMEYDGILIDLPLTQLMFISSMSPFASNADECHDVAEILYWGIHNSDVLPLITEHNGEELANRCLISLSLFKRALITKCERHGAPSPDYYRNVGIRAFIGIGREDIGNHFKLWEHFIGEMLVIKPIEK